MKLWAAPEAVSLSSTLWCMLAQSIEYAMKASDAKAEVLAANSHVHDNGFTKIVLYDSADGRYRIRLHTWDPFEVEEQDVNIHDHRYDFVSLVVSGTFENRRWNFCDHGTEYKLFRYFARDEAGTYRLELVDRLRLAPNPVEVYSAGGSYLMMRDELHTAHSSPYVRSVTFCVQNRSVLKPQARTLSLSHPAYQSAMSAPSLDLEEYRKKIRDIYVADVLPVLQGNPGWT